MELQGKVHQILETETKGEKNFKTKTPHTKTHKLKKITFQKLKKFKFQKTQKLKKSKF